MPAPADHLAARARPARGGPVGDLDGLVLLDLPDHDSTEVEHHLEVDRLVELADLLVWVLDPQKYADAAIHERYLRRWPAHEAVTLVVLNQIDTLTRRGRRVRRRPAPAARRGRPAPVAGPHHLGAHRRGHRRAARRCSPTR